MSELSRKQLVPNTWLAAHFGHSPDMAPLHGGMPMGGAYYTPHRHVIREAWSVYDKNAMANHIDSYHTPPKVHEALA